MATWISLNTRDSYLSEIAKHIEGENSLAWSGIDETFHAWLDIETANWVVVYVATGQSEAWDRGGYVKAKAYIAPADHVLTFGRRFSAPFAGKYPFDGSTEPTQAEALALIASQVTAAFGIQ